MSDKNNIEATIAEFNQILEDFENGKIPLEQASKMYKRSIKLADTIKSHFAELKNEITVLAEDFAKSDRAENIND
ncbi:MAG: exodeoxyribonuclease VII small subunit [Candidatus Sacchiramonaceae bacterium]|nr:exodeoxyribonuclease VII small subunit [Candidatus Saccharimonadaceae bacterium]